MGKRKLGMTVLEAAEQRVAETFDRFERVYLSFSEGKDSGVMLHLVAREARRRGRKFGLLFVDLEAQYASTIEYLEAMYAEYADLVQANDYNPNSVARPEMELLRLSIESNGFTQPIVVWEVDGGFEVIDGFHRHLVGKEMGLPKLPVVVVNDDSTDRNDRIAATIRHNRARGKHQIEAMSEIVQELARRNWSEKKIGKELGMDPGEVLRLKQITGLAEMFADDEFSEAWEAE